MLCISVIKLFPFHFFFKPYKNISIISFLYFVWVFSFRKNSQYCYKNLASGEIQWEYPGVDLKSEESDEMDICTTPPPNAEEQLNDTLTLTSARKNKDGSILINLN